MATLAANATPEAKKARNDEACSTAETFVNLGGNSQEDDNLKDSLENII